MSQSLVADLREISEIARQLRDLRAQALGVITKSDERTDREDAIAAVALITDQRTALRVAFDSLHVRSFAFDDLLEKIDDDFFSAVAVKDGDAFYDLRDGELGGAATNPEVIAGLEKALSHRLETIRAGLVPIKHLLT
jgi:hypothetical protein